MYYFSIPIPALADIGKQVMQAMNGNLFSYVGSVNEWVLLRLMTLTQLQFSPRSVMKFVLVEDL